MGSNLRDRARSLLHRHLWPLVPRDLRRQMLFRISNMAAPRPSYEVSAAAPLIVVGALKTASGLGESARLCHDALRSAGLPVQGIDLTSELMQQVDRPGLAFVDGRGHEGPGTLILHVNSPLVPLALWQLGARTARGKYVVGYWAWELPDCPSEWQFGIPFVHEIWVPSQFAAKAIAPIAGTRPVHVLPHPVALDARTFSTEPCDDVRPFTVLTMFNAASSVARKNPLAAVRAFRRAFGDDDASRLVVKTSNTWVAPDVAGRLREEAGSSRNITVVDVVMNAAEMHGLYRQSDVLLSLHRSEGFGLVLAEAMLRGLPVIATDWSGNADFLTPETGVPVPYRLVPAEDPQHTYNFPRMTWAEPDVDAAAQALRQLREDRERARRLGRNANAFAMRAWSAGHYADLVRSYLGI